MKALLLALIVPFIAFAAAKHKSPVRRSAASTLSATVTIDDPSIYSQVIALSDVHGMYDELVTLLTSGGVIGASGHWSAGNTLLVVVGDSIDKGPKSVEVLDLWIRLQSEAAAQGGRLIHLLGNHEAEFLSSPGDDHKAKELLQELRQRAIPVEDLISPSTARGGFLLSEPVAARVGRWIFCHSGFLPTGTWNSFTAQATNAFATGYDSDFFIGGNSILEAKNWQDDSVVIQGQLTQLPILGAFGVVFGHQPTAFHIKGRSAALNNGHLVKIDNGMAPEAGSHAGSVLTFVHPREMTTDTYPTLNVTDSSGHTSQLQPE